MAAQSPSSDGLRGDRDSRRSRARVAGGIGIALREQGGRVDGAPRMRGVGVGRGADAQDDGDDEGGDGNEGDRETEGRGIGNRDEPERGEHHAQHLLEPLAHRTRLPPAPGGRAGFESLEWLHPDRISSHVSDSKRMPP